MPLRHISGWVNITGPDGPIDPGYGRPDWGAPSPPDPDYGRPDIGGGRPNNDLPSGGGGHIWATLIRWLMRPTVGGGPIKPPGLWPIVPGPIDPGWGQGPVGPPDGPGDWIPIDPGFGKPPLWGFLPVDPGWGVGKPPVVDNTLPGHWVPVDPDFGKPVGPGCGGQRPPHVWGKPLWAYIFEIGPEVGLPIAGTPEPK
jgi:hypothetical protein